MSALSPAGKRNPACSAGEYMSTSLRLGRWRFCRCRPTRSGSQGGRRDLLVGLCDGGQKPTVARRGSESPSRRPTDPCSTTASVRLWSAGEDLGGDRRALKLQKPGSETLPQAASYR